MSEPLFTEAGRKVAYESIVEQVESAVAAGRLKAGDRLPGERQLMAEFGVSRSTVREALKVLQATGSIITKPGDPRGPIITNYSPRLLENSIQRFARLESVSRAELLQFRLSLESTACRLAAQLHDDADLERIVEAQKLMEAAAREEAVKFPEATNRFDDTLKVASHNQIIRVCGNAVADVMRELVYARLAQDPDRDSRMLRQARAAGELVEAIRNRDSARAASIVRRNIYRFYAEDLTPEEDRQTRALVYLEEDERDDAPAD
ncbi:FadR family transcriptional regulator [Leucobacter sp. CSA1]|uniref:FadR family transcriptional regulator n=1 Tax=Leucobacter chromiisoli TaxID=2796471 RepID=A0A934Q583_9MICO|nr:GntR family transcriptional regulator [Leucobacter chromiisoli]MBK0417806.1 FadR family transcriptional regulator [Leucobacter chromiisoli]